MTAAYKYIISTGVVSVDSTDLLSDIQAEYRAALGENLNIASSTPQGSLITSETLARTNTMKNNAEMANLINPQQSYGTHLDAICSFLGIKRTANKSTVVTGVQMTGTVGITTNVPAGSRVQSNAGDIFTVAADFTIPVSGTTTATLNSVSFGPIPLAVGAMKIIDGTIGWGTAACVASSVVSLGANALSDGQLKNKRNGQLAIQGRGSVGAIIAALLDVPNVTSVKVVENNTGAVGTVNGITFTLAAAVWVCVAGTATQSDIARALHAAHNGGTPWDYGAVGQGVRVGATAGVLVTDDASGMNYRVKYNTPVMYDLYVYIEVAKGTSTSSPEQAVPAAIMSFANGEQDGEPGLIVGAGVSAFQLGGAVARQLPGLYVGLCAVAAVPAGAAAPVYPTGYSSELVLPPYQQAQLTVGRVRVVMR